MESSQKLWPGGNETQTINWQQTITPFNEEFLTELESLMDIESHAFELKPGSKLFRQGSSADRFYLILDGCLKESYVDQAGIESILGFYYSNEFMGLESLGEPAYEKTAEAITSCQVSGIPCPELKSNLFTKSPELEHYVWGMMGEAITAARKRVNVLHLEAADQKLATFLLAQCKRFCRIAPIPLEMPMARQDIACYLGMSAETLSRLFTRFEDNGLIRSTKKQVEIVDHAGLTALLHREG
ncbi:Crp/Fnr family transcriptional regulator [Marinobacter sp. HL-58]|uniref:Crp/Fnr family transcriptional regulator n=1 Tax=Marinobacter sp. HL-58 TaxID=1479237 RepID=UPI000489B556|nr:Crp/Fnr family transcriptional regulator [Marinobacter sp. HL-58]KPP98889.1 MAG: Crp/Fnr family transcriptional regulator [Marinobacter sp. HL-58]